MKLEDIGFYTLSDKRALTATHKTPLHRCEVILTDRCNFSCPYCRGLKNGNDDMSYENLMLVLKNWTDEGLKNVRFSGGEPTLHPWIYEAVRFCENNGVERIAISSNGYSDRKVYEDLIKVGVNDFSISLDGCCSAVGDMMAGGIPGAFEKVVSNIRFLSTMTYVTLGLVFTEDNIGECKNTVLFADSLGASDIRVIPSAQYNESLSMLSELGDEFMGSHPILKYRINNVKNGRHVRGLRAQDTNKCYLALDDMAVYHGVSLQSGRIVPYHYPCIIYMREGGLPIGRITDDPKKMREDRMAWAESHDSKRDPICSKNCLDVCIDYNNLASRRATYGG